MRGAKPSARNPSARKRRGPVQLALALRTWGGKRRRAGRKPKGEKPGVSHRRRPALAKRFPVHVTVRMLPHVWNLRSKRSFTKIGDAVRAAAQRFEMRLCEFSVQGNHVHLVIEAADRTALSRGMQGLGIRLARGLNKMMDRKGTVLDDRYHAHILRTPGEVRHAVHYVRHNYKKHLLERGERLSANCIDPFSSLSREHGIALSAPNTWLLTKALAKLAAPS